MAIHMHLPITDSHFAHAFEYSNEASRTSASGFVAGDVGKLALQLDDNSIWILTSTTPNWGGVSGGGSGEDTIHTGSSAPSDTNMLWLDTNTSPYTLKYYNGSAWVPVAADVIGGGSSGYHEIEMRPNAMRLDDIHTGADRGVAWGYVDTVDFSSSVDGGVWVSFMLSSNWSTSKDINFTFAYNCNGNDLGKTISITAKIFILIDSTTPSPLTSPDLIYYEDITSNSSNVDSNKVWNSSIIKVPSSSITSISNSIALKFQRNGFSDSYSGTFQLMMIRAFQIP